MIAVTCEQPVDEREFRARDLRDQHVHHLFLVGLQRLQAECRRAVLVCVAQQDRCRLRGSASMAGVGRDDGEAALEAGVPKRSGVAAEAGATTPSLPPLPR
jgi:hypothetical protein